MARPKRSTKEVREAHIAGTRRLLEAFRADRLRISMAGLQHGRATPVRLRPNVPPLRSPEYQAKHRKRKAARAARKRNRVR